MQVEYNNKYYQEPELHIALGIATGEAGQSLEQALRLADDRMYADKRQYHHSAGQ